MVGFRFSCEDPPTDLPDSIFGHVDLSPTVARVGSNGFRFGPEWFGWVGWVRVSLDTPTKGHCRKRWLMVSSFSLHIRHLLLARIPLLFKIEKIGRLSCRIFQMKVRIFRGNLTSQISCQVFIGMVEVL